MERPRKTCTRCGLEDAPFGFNKSRPNGLSPYCKMCMDELRVIYPQKKSWKEINATRRANPEYRAKERKRQGELDAERRKKDKAYVERRLQDHYRYLEKSGIKKARQEAYNAKRRAATAARAAARTPEEIADIKARQLAGFYKAKRIK